MPGCRGLFVVLAALAVVVAITSPSPPPARSACCYFSAQEKDIEQPAQKVFITWDPQKRVETFTVQPQFKGNAPDFGMVIPTPSRPQLDEMPRDFFKELAVYTILKQRQQPYSMLMWQGMGFAGFGGGIAGLGGIGGGGGAMAGFVPPPPPRPPAVRVVEAGLVGTLDYKILSADRADDLYTWLRDHKYHYAGDEATLDHYVQKKWFFTVMKIDTMQMKRNPDGTFVGEVTPTRFQFATPRLAYPLKITQLSVKDKTEALFYVQAPFKVDLPGDWTYQYQWVPLLQTAQRMAQPLPGRGEEWLRAIGPHIPGLLRRGQELGFGFAAGQRPLPNAQGQTAATLEWAKRLTPQDILVLVGRAPYSDSVPNVDAGFDARQMNDPQTAAVIRQVIAQRLEQCRRARPKGYLVREAPIEDVRQLKLLVGHLQAGQFLTKFRKTFTRAEMDDDLLLVPARLGDAVDTSEYEEILPTSPP